MALAADPSSWLADQLDGIRSRADLQGINLEEALWSGLPWDARRELDALLPQALPIPSGREARLDYSSGEPVLAAKLQELFGAASTPTVLGGRMPVTVQLLSPAGRPAAITQDLAGFWDGAYREVRKEMRGRYPRHPWPDDPANTPATALTKRALERRQSQR
jgi:ATP-dependent helicase HrpB